MPANTVLEITALSVSGFPNSSGSRMSVLDAAGAQVATLDLRWFANETDEDIEISRDRLNQILLRATALTGAYSEWCPLCPSTQVLQS